jgi:hypothetical protein
VGCITAAWLVVVHCLDQCAVPQVSKHTFLAALKERGAVLFCPGGQAEMVHAWKAFLPAESRELVLHTRHKGFCRYVVVFIYKIFLEGLFLC